MSDFGLANELAKDSTAVRDTRAYFAPEQFTGKVGRKGDLFSLGLIFIEFGLLLFGQKGWKDQISSGFYMDIIPNLGEFLKEKVALHWWPCYRGLVFKVS
jgi:serine/threonine protein kinase